MPGQLHGGLHLHVVLEEALPERGLVVGLVRLGLDGRLHAGLGHLRRRSLSPDAAHCVVVVPQVRRRVCLLQSLASPSRWQPGQASSYWQPRPGRPGLAPTQR